MKLKKMIGNIRRNNYKKRNKLIFDYTGQEASDKIAQYLSSNKPVMICRFGSGELECLCRIMTHESGQPIIVKLYNYLSGRNKVFLPQKDDFIGLKNNAGVFNIDKAGLEDFKNVYLSSIPSIDILGSWCEDENNPLLKKYFNKEMKKIPLRFLEPYYVVNPWSSVLKDKNILVIHPFATSIENQYKNHTMLFNNSNILPDFHLKTLKAVQSISGQKTEFIRWIDALNYMKEQISKIDFDIALIGCGAYGLPLAAHCKSIGKKAVHIGGALQILFGIQGARWDENEFISNLYNEYWSRPLESERPENASSVENGCYW